MLAFVIYIILMVSIIVKLLYKLSDKDWYEEFVFGELTGKDWFTRFVKFLIR